MANIDNVNIIIDDEIIPMLRDTFSNKSIEVNSDSVRQIVNVTSRELLKAEKDGRISLKNVELCVNPRDNGNISIWAEMSKNMEEE